MIIQAEHLVAQWFQLDHLLLQLKLGLFLRGQLTARGNSQDIVIAIRCQPLRTEYDLQRLTPGHIFQAQQKSTRHTVADHDAEVREVGKDLQQQTRINALEVQRQALTAAAGARNQLVRVLLGWTHLHHKLRAGLVRVVLSAAVRLDDQACACAVVDGTHDLYRHTEIARVIAMA